MKSRISDETRLKRGLGMGDENHKRIDKDVTFQFK